MTDQFFYGLRNIVDTGLKTRGFEIILTISADYAIYSFWDVVHNIFCPRQDSLRD